MVISYLTNLDLWATLFGPMLATALFPVLNRRDADELKHAEPLFSAFMDHLPGCAWIKTAADGRYVYLNRAARELFSFEVDFLGKSDAELFGPDIAGVNRENDRKVVQTAATVETVEPIVIKGEPRFLLVSKFPILDEAGTVVMIGGTCVDITEHRRVEEELRRSESFRRAIIESEPECVKLVAQDYTLMDMNPAGLAMVEASSREQVVGQSVLDMLVPEYRAAFVDMHQRVFKGESLVLEFEIVGLQGSHRWIETHASPLRDKESNVIAQLAISRDVTFRKRAEDALKESRQYLRALFENSLDVILVTNDKGQYIDANPAACELLGYTYDELMKLSVMDLTPEPLRHQGKAIWNQFIADGSQHGEHSTLCKDGSVLELEFRAAQVMPGVYLFSSRDITERKRVEQVQRESKQQYESLVHSIDGIVWEVDAQTFTFTFVSKQAERILGYPLEHWFDGPTFWRDHMHPQDRDWAIGYCLDSTAKRVDHQFEYRMIAADGRVVWLSDIVTVHVADDGSVVLRGVMVDITERKLMEEKLRQNESQLAEAQHLAHLGSWSWSLADNKLNWSDELYRLFGLDPAEFEPSYEAIFQFLHPDDRESFDQLVRHALQTPGPFSFYYRVVLPGDEVRIIHSQGTVVVDEHGTPTRMFGAAQDVTERKQAEAALREAEQKYRDIFENAGEGIFQSTPDGRVLAANPVFARMHGYESPEELLRETQDFSELMLIDPKRNEEFRQALADHGVVKEFEKEICRRDGKKIWIAVNARAVRDQVGALSYYEGTAQDITARKHAEQTLRESEERYRELFENAKDATYVHDLEGRYMSVNRAAEKLSGYTREEILGKSLIPMVPPEQVSNLRWQLWQKLANEGETSYESEVIRKDGRRVAVEINSHLIFENGVPVGVQGTARDITLRKAAEEKLKASSEQLRALSARLQSAREEEGTRISREIHDELGSVLTSLKWDLEGVDKVLSGKPVEMSQLPGMREKVQSLIKLSDTAITSIRRIASELRPSVLDDLGLVAAIEWQAQQFQARTGILCDYESVVENLSLDREQSTAVFRILQEALTNVLRHAQASRVRIQLIRDDGHFTLSVSDNGIGIAEIDKSKQQLGILGMRERAHLIGARLEIKPGRHQGTVVTVRVPLDDSELVLDHGADVASGSPVLVEE